MTAATESQLRQLREGDRLTYHGVLWRVDDYSTYADDHGYETEEWLLKSQTGKEYYLMREIDPNGVERKVQWYLAEEVRSPSIFDPESSRDVTLQLREDVRSGREPYPQLRMYNRTYKFESQTAGDYESDGETRDRITWDYWDEAHLWNLALEAWSNGTLNVYSTRTVQPPDFTHIQTGQQDFAPIDSRFSISSSSGSRPSTDTWQFVAAWTLVIIGILFIFAGI
ncbi:DUF4178 domain-containing protein [Pantanalinema sp. GBBB05]|uniref:DUF4178 domain-containing protein n=1 Tax=Pantanalinema sp. GBBB05 TaxID=2604139 RepID=UPI001DC08F01|nr:DUF4178 domain-containing protein [Pantanalinema sp. GBBB05]